MQNSSTHYSGDAWKLLRLDRGWTQAELARRAGVDPVTIWRLEHGQPTSDLTRARVRKAFDHARELVPA